MRVHSLQAQEHRNFFRNNVELWCFSIIEEAITTRVTQKRHLLNKMLDMTFLVAFG